MHRLERSGLTRNGSALSSVDYAYDAVGNIQKKTDFSANQDNAYVYPAVDSVRADNGWAGPNAVRSVTLPNNTTRLYDYDANGNLESDGIRNIAYTAFNKPQFIATSASVINPALDIEVGAANTLEFFYGADRGRYKQIATQG